MLNSKISLVKEIIFVSAALATIVVAFYSLGGFHFDNRASADKVAISSPSSKRLETTNTFQKKTLMEKEDLPIEIQRSNSGTASETSVAPLELSYVRQGDLYADAGNLTSLAEEVTDKMVYSEQIDWKDRPILFIAVPENRTNNEGLDLQILQDKIDGRVLHMRIAKLTKSPKFDYILKPTLYSQEQRGGNGKMFIQYTLQYKLYDDANNQVGQWSAEKNLVRGANSLF